jgi:hypothetical protein
LSSSSSSSKSIRKKKLEQKKHPHLKNLDTASDIWPVNCDLAIKPPRPKKSRVEDIGPVGGSKHNDAAVAGKAVHLREQLVNGLLPLIHLRELGRRRRVGRRAPTGSSSGSSGGGGRRESSSRWEQLGRRGRVGHRAPAGSSSGGGGRVDPTGDASILSGRSRGARRHQPTGTTTAAIGEAGRASGAAGGGGASGRDGGEVAGTGRR